MYLKEVVSEYEGLIDRLYKAENWALDNGYEWEDVKKHLPKIYKSREDIIKKLEKIQEDMHKHKATI